MRTSSIVRAISRLDGGLSTLGTNCQLRIRYLPNDLPRDGYKNKGKLDSYTNKGKLRLRLGLGRAVRKLHTAKPTIIFHLPIHHVR